MEERLPADYSRIHRLLKILTLIQGAKGWTAKRLAGECNTTERTIFRDLKMLEGAGIPYFYDEENKGYAVRRDFFLPPVQLTLDEALAASALAEHIGGQEQIPFMTAASRAIKKIRGQLPHSIQKELDQIDCQVAIKLAAGAAPEASADAYETVRSAIARRTMLQCRYESLQSQAKPNGAAFLFKPYTLLFNQRAWYVLGHHGGHDEVRCLKLNRFSELKPTDHPYLIPKNFKLSDHLGNAWRMIRGKKTYSIELHFDAEFAETVADTHWHATQEVLWSEDGSIQFHCRIDGLDEIVWWILSMGPHCIVKKPAELAERVRELAGQIVQRYSPHERTSPKQLA